MTMYQVCYNNAAGEAYIQEWSDEDYFNNWMEAGVRNQYGYFNVVADVNSRKKAEAELEALRGEPVYAVYENNAAGEAYISMEDGLSGNWRGSKHGYFNLVGEHEKKADAEKQLDNIRKYYQNLG